MQRDGPPRPSEYQMMGRIKCEKKVMEGSSNVWYCLSDHSMKSYVVGTHWKCLVDKLSMSTTTHAFLENLVNYERFFSR